MDDTVVLEFNRIINTAMVNVVPYIQRNLSDWLCDSAVIDPKVNGKVFFWWNNAYFASGVVKQYNPDSSIRFSWYGKDDPNPTEVEITAVPQTATTTNIIIKHSGIGTSELWETRLPVIRKSWETSMDNLKTISETGFDPRLYRRPMLGILAGRFITGEKEEDKSLPISHGILVDDTLSGMGAESAGLCKKDIIANIAGVEIIDQYSIAQALEPYKGDDVVDIIIFRDQKEMKLPLKLSSRKKPEIPLTIGEMVNNLREKYNVIEQQYAVELDKITDEEASQKPTPTDWCVHEILSHLIVSDKLSLHYVASILASKNTIFTPDLVTVYQNTILAINPDLASLRREWKNAQSELISFIQHIPEKYITAKSNSVRIFTDIIDSLYLHTDDHLQQIRDTITTIRMKQTN